MRLRFSGFAVLICCWLTPAFSQHMIANIAVGNHPMYLAVDEETNRIYVSNQLDDTVSVIDGATNLALHTIKVGHTPNGVAVNQRTNTIYVANLTGGSLSIIDGTKLTSSNLRLGFNPSKVAVNPSTDRVYVTIENENGFLDVINAGQRKLMASVPLPPYPLSVAVDSDSDQIYVADFLCGCGRISEVDGATNRVTKTIRLPGASLVGGVALNQGHDRVYATDENNGFYIIDRINGKVLGRVSGLDSPNEVASIPGTSFAVEPDSGSNRAVFINTSTFGVTKRVPVGKFPTGVAVNVKTRRVYVANRDSDTVSVIQLPRTWWEDEVQ
jgi:YVTN family beta-propeller protein